jgi:hypothetical protein
MFTNLFFIKNENALLPEYACSVEPISIEEAYQLDMRDGDKICINSESCLEVVHTRLKDGHTKKAIDLLKDKFAFRNALAPLFPDFHFHKTSLCSLENVDRRSIIKPVRGFFSAGVHELQPNQSLDSIKQKIAADVEKLSCYFPPSVLSSDDWLVEDYIEGEEISIDMYYNEKGSPVILNITAHPMPKDLAYLNAVYWTSDDLMRKWYQKALDFFDYLNKKVLNVTHFPIHGEFRIHNNCLVPIELNPLRFGGFGLADLAYYGWGINSYDAFFKGEEPSWEDIWQSRQANRFCWVLAYNGKNIDKTRQKPNHEQFISFCGKENLLHYRALEWEKQPVFAIAYLSCQGSSTIDALLSLDFNQFF